MAHYDALVLARYGIFQPTVLRGAGVVTVLHPLSELGTQDRLDLREMACMALDGSAPQGDGNSGRGAAQAVPHDDDDDDRPFDDDDDERLIDEY